MGKTVNGGADAPLKLRPMCSDDVFGIVAVISAIGLNNIKIDPETVKKSKFTPPMQMVDGKQVPLPWDKWTRKQKEAEKDAEIAKNEISATIGSTILSHFWDCRQPVYNLLAMAADTDPKTVQSMKPAEFLQLATAYMERDEFVDFFTQAVSVQGKSAVNNVLQFSTAGTTTPTP
ncbi:MAG: hypothetical protein PUE04_00970 [Lachnospira sp.]|nr:hypothetical protein [Lachnospira sp.]